MAPWWDTKSGDPYALNIRSDFCKGEHKAWIEAPELRIQEGPKKTYAVNWGRQRSGGMSSPWSGASKLGDR